MEDTVLLDFIINELMLKGYKFGTQKDIFEFLVPNEPWEKYKKSWYHWSHKVIKSMRKSNNIKMAISQRLGVNYAIWGASEEFQINEVRRAIDLLSSQKKSIDLNSLIPKESPLTDKQEDILNMILLSDEDKMEAIFLENEKFFKREFENQRFLLNLVTILYEKALYDLLDKYIFPALMQHNRCNDKIKIIEAHTIGSIKKPRFRESVRLLECVGINSDEELIDIKTAVISNIRRSSLSKIEDKEELKDILTTLVKYYFDVYTFNQSYHYYPAVNLIYMLKLFDYTLKSDEFKHIDLQKIKSDIKKSIAKDLKTKELDKIYYAKVSELEIRLLTGVKNISREFGLFLEELSPNADFAKRTKRTMQEFVDIVERFCDDCKEDMQKIKKTIEVFDDYLVSRS